MFIVYMYIYISGYIYIYGYLDIWMPLSIIDMYPLVMTNIAMERSTLLNR